MKAHSLRLLALSSLAFGACAEGPQGPQVTIDVAPLQLDGVTNAIYNLRVYNGDPSAASATPPVDLVWEQNGISADQYGNSLGAITYIGTCDASVGGSRHNFVELELVDLYAADSATPLTNQSTVASGDTPDYVNPAPVGDPVVLDFECLENADVFVEFNLTIIRRAQQGFFDIAVNFDDIFCSAKFDSCYAEDGNTGGVKPVRDVFVGEIAGKPFDAISYDYQGATKALPRTVAFATNRAELGSLKSGEEISPTNLIEFGATGQTGIIFLDLNELQPADPTKGKLIARAVKDAYTTIITDEVRTITDVKALATGATVAAVTRPENVNHGTKEMDLLFGENGRQHTAVAALACTAGPDEANDDIATTLVLAQPVVICNGASFKIPLADDPSTTTVNEGAGGNHSVGSTAGSYTLNYALYYGPEQLECGDAGLSCNKTYFNIGLNIEDLATQGLKDCRFSWGGTAFEASQVADGDNTTTDTGNILVDDEGDFTDGAAVYGAVTYSNIPLTTGKPDANGKIVALCSMNPVNGYWSGVQSAYLKGSDFADASDRSADFYSEAGTQAESFGRN